MAHQFPRAMSANVPVLSPGETAISKWQALDDYIYHGLHLRAGLALVGLFVAGEGRMMSTDPIPWDVLDRCDLFGRIPRNAQVAVHVINQTSNHVVFAAAIELEFVPIEEAPSNLETLQKVEPVRPRQRRPRGTAEPKPEAPKAETPAEPKIPDETSEMP